MQITQQKINVEAALMRLIDDKGVIFEQIAIVPMGFCFPGLDAKGGDLPPRKECAPQWRSRVFEQLDNVSLTLLVGGYAQKWHLKAKAKKSLTETVAAWRDYLPQFLPLPHPSWRNNAWIKKHSWFEQDVIPELQMRISQLIEAKEREVV